MLATASQIERAILCPASQLLPRNRKEPGAAAKRGTMAHALIISEVRGWKKPDGGKYRIRYDIDQLRAYMHPHIDDVAGSVYGELAMTWVKPGNVIVHGENIGRDYPAIDGIHGTADLVVVSDGAALVLDIKTGQARGPASSSWQLRHNAVCVAGAYGCDTVTGCLAYLARDGSWAFDGVTFGEMALDAIESDLGNYANQAASCADLHEAGWDPPMNPSDQACRYCECECPARYQVAA